MPTSFSGFDLSFYRTHHPFLNEMSKDISDYLEQHSEQIKFKKGESIFSAWQKANDFYLIAHGAVALSECEPGEKELIVRIVGQGDILGWSWLYAPYRYRFNARSLETTYALKINGGIVRTKCKEDNAFGYKLLKSFTGLIIEQLHASKTEKRKR